MKFEIPENSNFGFSGDSPADMKDPSDEYTITDIAIDVSPSTGLVRDNMCKGMQTVVEACKQNPRAEKLMIRLSAFGSRIEEIHGFKPVNDIDPNDYQPLASIGGSTCLYDAIYNSVSAVSRYSEILDKSDIGSNGIVFCFTDGMDNSSSLGAQSILDKLNEIRMKEILESIKIVIIGFGGSDVKSYLDKLTNDLGLDQFVNVDSMSAKEAAKVFGFVSQSISAQSQHLGTGGPSQNLTF